MTLITGDRQVQSGSALNSARASRRHPIAHSIPSLVRFVPLRAPTPCSSVSSETLLHGSPEAPPLHYAHQAFTGLREGTAPREARGWGINALLCMADCLEVKGAQGLTKRMPRIDSACWIAL